jgi:hypothetical protein
MFNFPSSATYVWTKHAQAKMAYYRISPSRVRRIIKSFLRVEEGIAPNTVAFMQPVSYKTKNGVRTWNQEYWVMAITGKPVKVNPFGRASTVSSAEPLRIDAEQSRSIKSKTLKRVVQTSGPKVKIISAWRYPGRTKPGASLPEEILNEVSQALRAL